MTFEDLEKKHPRISWSGAEKTSRFVFDHQQEKITKLKQLLLLVDPKTSSYHMNDLSAVQWAEFIKCFPEEGSK